MRVGFDVTLAARVSTGVGVYARELAPALAARGLDVQRWQQPIGPAGRRLGRLVNGLRLVHWQARGCARRAALARADVVHAAAAVGPLRVRCPVVMTVHDATTVTMPLQSNPADRLFQHLFAVRAARRADALLVPSQAAAADIAEHYGVPPDRIRVVPLGVSHAFRMTTARDTADVRTRYGLDRPYVLYAGADAPRKNLATLIRAMATGPAPLRDLDIVLTGPSGARGAGLDAVAREAGWPRPLRRLGIVPEALLPGIYAGASCLAYVSLHEGFGLPIIEAMAVGTPVVTSDCSAMAEVAGDAALLVDPHSVEAVADGLVRAITDSAVAERLRRLGLQRSATFDWAATARLTHAVYDEVCGRRATAPPRPADGTPLRHQADGPARLAG